MKRLLLCIGLVFLLSLGANSAWAHDAIFDLTGQDFGLGDTVYLDHYDQDVGDGYKGTLTLRITNTGDEAWGDFHFFSTDTRVTFLVDSGYPNMFDQGGVTPYGATIDTTDPSKVDFYFYTDPVYSGETVVFAVYTDNTEAELSLFSIGLEASPVPVPAAVWLLGSGLLGLMGLRRKN